ncbi:MAG: hypothetical protein CME70_09130 [Halobacteriovorax sp.]|nr:hypothetical protein [Halobacteriovorax sp.]|tara:strand:- start:22788 stop:23402 length:615 start_codon:yes stop_codon:yes gene_type:complete
MKKSSALLFIVSLLSAPSVWAYGTGQSTYPLMEKQHMVSTEITGITSTGGGVGMQGRYTRKMNKRLVLDGGFGLSSGDRANRIFAGADLELFPDYMNQPRVSIKTSLENAKEFKFRRNILTVAPTVSKGFNFWGEEAYPFASLPFGVQLINETKQYETVANVNLGILGNLPFDGYRKFTASAEVTVDIKDSYTGVFLGLSYPLN